jgi:hypothetical protein
MCLLPPQLILLSMSFMRTFILLHIMDIFLDNSLIEFHKLLYVSCCFLTFLYDFPGRSLNFKRTSRPCQKDEGERFCDI